MLTDPITQADAPACRPPNPSDAGFELSSSSSATEDIERYLSKQKAQDLLRFVAVGSVDDGKSTLIGRLLHDTHGVYEDQLSAVKKATKQENQTIDFSLFTDGLKAEREQGITIDVAYRYFSTENRKFIIADTPGHIQYTRNMATGASTAHVAIIVIDARKGVQQQSKRHAYIASLLGIPHLFVCINKMDLVGYDPAVYREIVAAFSEVVGRLSFTQITYIPISALNGDNVVHPSEHTRWYFSEGGQTLLSHLETVQVGQATGQESFRFPVQYVIRPNLDYRGFAAQIASGSVRTGDRVLVLPSRRESRVRSIDSYGGELSEAFAPMSVTLRLEDEIDISRGDILVSPSHPPRVSQGLLAQLVWLAEAPLDPERSYLIKHSTQYVRANVEEILWGLNLETLEREQVSRLELNEIGCVRLHAHRPIFYDAYAENRSTGAFIIIDALTNNTVAAGMLLSSAGSPAKESIEAPHPEALPNQAGTRLRPEQRFERLGQRPAFIQLSLKGTGINEAELSAIAEAIEEQLFELGRSVVVLSGEAARRELLHTDYLRWLAQGFWVIEARPAGEQLGERLRAELGASYYNAEISPQAAAKALAQGTDAGRSTLAREIIRGAAEQGAFGPSWQRLLG